MSSAKGRPPRPVQAVWWDAGRDACTCGAGLDVTLIGAFPEEDDVQNSSRTGSTQLGPEAQEQVQRECPWWGRERGRMRDGRQGPDRDGECNARKVCRRAKPAAAARFRTFRRSHDARARPRAPSYWIARGLDLGGGRLTLLYLCSYCALGQGGAGVRLPYLYSKFSFAWPASFLPESIG